MKKVTNYELNAQFPNKGMSEYLKKYGGEMAQKASEVFRSRRSNTGKIRYIIRLKGKAYFGQSEGIDGMCGAVVRRPIPEIKWEREPYYDA